MCSSKKSSRVLMVFLIWLTAAVVLGTGAVSAYGATVASAVKKAKVRVSLTPAETSMTVKWNKVKKADGYEVYRSTSKNGKYKKITTIRKAGTVKFVNKKLKEGTAYYYKVRAFEKTKKKTSYSKYSKVQGKKTLMSLNTHVDQFLKKAVTPAMTKEQKLKAAYTYMRDHYKYIKRDMAAKNNKTWVSKYAKAFFADKGGNCYSWAAAYTTVAKKIGYPANALAGKLYHADGKLWGEHAWTEIVIDETAYVFDPEIEYAYKQRGEIIDLYKISYTNDLFRYEKR